MEPEGVGEAQKSHSMPETVWRKVVVGVSTGTTA
jgi:hypothetical protein